MEGPTRKRGFRQERKSGELYCLGGLRVLPRKFLYFELPRLDFLQFQHDFRSFSDKTGTFTRGGGGGQNPLVGGGGGSSGPSSIYAKRGHELNLNSLF